MTFPKIAAALVACVLALPAVASAQGPHCAHCQGGGHGGYSSHGAFGGQSGQGVDLFYNYYVGPGPQGAYVSGMYPAPRPVPPHVGGTYYTYQPLYPHHYLEAHRLHYTNGDRQVFVRYGAGPLHSRVKGRMADPVEFNWTTLYSPF